MSHVYSFIVLVTVGNRDRRDDVEALGTQT